MGRKRKRSQYHKFKKLRKKTSTPQYALLRANTQDPDKIMKAVWERLGKTLNQMLHDVYKVIDEYMLEKILYEGSFTLDGFGTLQLEDKPCPKSNDGIILSLKFIPDEKLKEKIKLLQKEI